MATVAARRIAALLAGAEEEAAVRLSDILLWFHPAADMGAVAKGLAGRTAAAAPPIRFSLLQIPGYGECARNPWLDHS